MNVVDNVNVSFQELIKELNEKGVTNRQIEKRSGASAATIQRIASGVNTNPKWSEAGVIINLHNYWCEGKK